MPSQDNRPRILLITRNLPPLVGGMERLMLNAALGFSQYCELTVIGPSGCSEHLPPEVTVHEAPPTLATFLLRSTWLAWRTCRSNAFDVVIGGSGLIAPTLWCVSRLFGLRSLVFLHGLDLVVDNRLYQALFIPCIRSVDHIVTNSRNTRDIAICKGISEHRVAIVNPGTDLPPPVDPADCEEFRRRHAIEFDRYMLFVGRMTKRKGLSQFLRHSLSLITGQTTGVGLVVVGDDPTDSLNRLGEQTSIVQALEEGGEQKNVAFLGQLSDRDLQICYADAAVQIFPLVDVPGDVEGFGMVAVEAAACGTPTVAFDLGGVADAVKRENGYLVPPEDFQQFARSVLHSLDSGLPGQDSCRQFAAGFNWNIYNEKVRTELDKLLSGSTP